MGKLEILEIAVQIMLNYYYYLKNFNFMQKNFNIHFRPLQKQFLLVSELSKDYLNSKIKLNGKAKVDASYWLENLMLVN